MINANAMPTQKKVLGVGGGFGKPYLQGENTGKPTVARLRTDFSPFICSPMNANAMPTLCQRKKDQDWEISLCSDPDSGGLRSDRRRLRPTVGVNAGVQCMV